MAMQNATNLYGTAKWIVDPVAGQGTHTTIATALTSASSGETIFIRPGTYTEDLTLKAGVNLTAFTGDSLTPNVTIVGNCTMTTAGTVSISNIRLQTNGSFALSVTGSAASIVNLTNCYLNFSNNTGITFTSSDASARINISHCTGDLGTTGIAIYSQTSLGGIIFRYTAFSNSGNSVTLSSNSAGGVQGNYSFFGSPLGTSSTGSIVMDYCEINTSAGSIVALTANGSGPNSFEYGRFQGGTASAITVGTGATLSLSGGAIVDSSNANAITGLGTLNYCPINFLGSSSVMNVSVSTPYTNGALIINSGTNAISISNDASATTVTLATGAAVKGLTLGSTNSTSSTTLQSGSGALAVTSTNGTLTINSGTGAFGISTDASATTVSFATGGAVKGVTLGSTNTTSSTIIKSGTGNIACNSGLTVDSTGRMLNTVQPAFGYHNSSGRSNVTGDGTSYNLIFNAATWTQQGAGFDGTSTFTAPVTGVYHFDLAVRVTGIVAQTSAYTTLTWSAGTTFYGQYVLPSAVAVGGALSLVQSVTVKMTAAATMIAAVVLGGSTKTVTVDGTAADTYYCGYLVC